MDGRTLHTRACALAIGAGIAVCIIALVFALFPAQSLVRENTEYGYVYSGPKSSSTQFVEAAMTDESLIVFGSSEFSTPRRIVPQVPSQVFGTADYGLQPMLIGEAFDQSLWHAMALGAYENAGIPRNKVAIIVSPGWFVDGGQDPDTFKTRFSYSLYSGFCANPRISDECKDYVRSRLVDLGIEQTQIDAASPAGLTAHLNNFAFASLDDLKLRQSLLEVREKGIERIDGGSPATPDFQTLRDEALEVAHEKASSNEWGVEDSFYAEQLEPALEDAAGSRADETYSDTPEYDDLDCFLDIADECGVDVLVIVSPVMGPYYDLIGITKDTRDGCYDRIRSIVAGHNAKLADFSDREYETYFLYDIVHFGWTGWVDVEQSLYEFSENGA